MKYLNLGRIYRQPVLPYILTSNLDWSLRLALLVIMVLLLFWLLPSPAWADEPTIALNTVANWLSNNEDTAFEVAWGDVDRDGDLDLAVGTQEGPKVYLNQRSNVQTTAIWFPPGSGLAFSVAWGDMDGDGNLDLAVGTDKGPQVYLNVEGSLQPATVWSFADGIRTDSVAWGDVDGDGDFDLATGAENGPKIYLNDEGMLQATPIWSANDSSFTQAVAWGDADNDGDLDLAVGNSGASLGLGQPGQQNKLYRNQGFDAQGKLQMITAWSSADSDQTFSIAWGDMDNDGHLDLAVGNQDASNKIYRNEAGTLTATAAWTSTDHNDKTFSVAWGDVDSDGDLDLAAGIWGQSKIYLNDGGTLQTAEAWTSADRGNTLSIAWGDVDSDGDLDLAVGNQENPQKVYLNEGAPLLRLATWESRDSDSIESMAWGDVNGDGALDLAVGGWNEPIKIYMNEGNSLQPDAAWISTDQDSTTSLAWGDMDGDGDLDLAVGNRSSWSEQYSDARVYRNDGLDPQKKLQLTPIWTSDHTTASGNVAWGDMDGDGDLDLAVGRGDPGSRIGAPNGVYLNEGGALTATAVWTSADGDDTESIAWGDMDEDGDLDLAAGNWNSPSNIYLNEGGTLQTTPVWTSTENYRTESIAWGDVDGDGDLDLAAGNFETPNRVYLNKGGILETSATWVSADSDDTTSIVWGDMDGDGDLDLATGNSDSPSKVYLNTGGSLQTTAAWTSANTDYTQSIAWGDMDGDGRLDLAVGNLSITDGNTGRTYKGGAKVYLNQRPAHPLYLNQPISLHLRKGNLMPTFSIPFTYTLFHPANILIRSVRGFYSPDGGGRWYTATATSDTITSNLTTSPYPTSTLTNTHVYTWDILASGFFGRSDNVVFRLEAYPSLRPITNSVPGPYQRPFIASQTFPFSVRGNQVQVFSSTVPISNALVYRLPATQSTQAKPITGGANQPFRTDNQGYLQGRGSLMISDTLVALLPITPTDSYTVYYTNASPTLTGLEIYTVTQLGVQTLTVSADNPLTLFNLDVSLEWDASKDERFVDQLKADLLRASELLFDWTDGQAALGQVTIYNDQQKWLEADIQVYATNRLRPHATIGGVVTTVISDPQKLDILYAPGQVRMGAVWNRFGDANGTLGEDWPRALAHELGHYLFFLDDNYLGFDDTGVLKPIEKCLGVMSDPYQNTKSEFRTDEEWQNECRETLSGRGTGRPDWETIKVFYPWLEPKDNPGPTSLPLAVTQIEFVAPGAPTAVLEVPIFYLPRVTEQIRRPNIQAFLFQGERLIDLGGPTRDQLRARGARPGDRLCIYELDTALPRLGCKIIQSGDEQLSLVAKSGWKPEVIVSPVTSRTITLSVPLTGTGLITSGAGKLQARIFPANLPALPPKSLEFVPATAEFTATFVLTAPAIEGYVQIWVEENDPTTRREIITSYTLGGNPVPIQIGGVSSQIGDVALQIGGVPIQIGGASMVSSDGQVTVFSRKVNFEPGEFYTLQSVTTIPSVPDWVKVVGQVYRLSTSANAPDMKDASISFRYLADQVTPGEETWLRIYFWDGEMWQQLPTQLNPNYNMVAAPTRGQGIYALMSSFEIPLAQGWNLVSYPIPEARSITEALKSIQASYKTICGYEPNDPNGDPWKVYRRDGAENDLTTLKFGQGYWINMKEAAIWQLKGASGAVINPILQGQISPAIVPSPSSLIPPADCSRE